MLARIKSFFPTLTVIFLLAWVGALAAGRTSFFKDPGTFWHTVLGEQIITSGVIPEYDSFTFTRRGEQWLTLQWLGELIMATAYRFSGWDGQLLLTATLLALFFTWLVHRGLQQGLHWLPACMLVVLVLGGCSHHFHVRPHLASMVLIGWTFARMCDVEAERVQCWRLVALIPLFAVWTNIHGGVLGGWLTVTLWLTAWMVWSWFNPSEDRETRRIRWFFLPLPIVLLATFLVNPYGITMPQLWVEIMTLPLQEIIDEHGPTALNRPEGILFVTILVAYLVVLCDAVRRRRRVVWLLPLLWALLAATRVRHVPLFAVTASLAIFDMIPYTRLSKRLAATESFFPELVDKQLTISELRRVTLIPIGCVLAAVTLQYFTVAAPLVGSGWAQLPRDRWPVGVVDSLEQLAEQGVQRRVFNDLSYGGYLTMHAPDWEIFVDDRCELFGGEFLQEYMRTQHEPQRIDSWSRDFDFQVALVRRGTPLDQHLSESRGWNEVNRQDESVLFVRREESEQ